MFFLITYVKDVKEDIEEMSKLVSELLIYSKARIKTLQVELENVNLLSTIKFVIEREKAENQAERFCY